MLVRIISNSVSLKGKQVFIPIIYTENTHQLDVVNKQVHYDFPFEIVHIVKTLPV